MKSFIELTTLSLRNSTIVNGKYHGNSDDSGNGNFTISYVNENLNFTMAVSIKKIRY